MSVINQKTEDNIFLTGAMDAESPINTEEYNKQVTKELVEALDHYVWYDMPTDLVPGIKAKSGQVLTALVYLLVEKDILNAWDIKRLIK